MAESFNSEAAIGGGRSEGPLTALFDHAALLPETAEPSIQFAFSLTCD
jgi:hypothetical protein